MRTRFGGVHLRKPRQSVNNLRLQFAVALLLVSALSSQASHSVTSFLAFFLSMPAAGIRFDVGMHRGAHCA